MKILHIGDCHLGCWRDERLELHNLNAFEKAIDIAIEKKVDAILISGDIFDVPLPSLQIIIKAMKKLRFVVEKGIKIYAIAGSHDISINLGAINLLEESAIIKNVDYEKSEKIEDFFEEIGEYCLFVIGLSGKRRGREVEQLNDLKAFLEKHQYEIKRKEEEIENKGKKIIKILLFHSTVDELNNLNLKFEMNSVSIDQLPKNFDYYALGHLHTINLLEKFGKFYVYPGPTFPTNFEELERLKECYCFIFDFKNKKIEKIPLKVVDIVNFHLKTEKNPITLTNKIIERFESSDLKGKIVTLRIEGMLTEGSISQIDFEKIKKIIESKGGIFLKNISKLSTKELVIDIKLEEISGMSIEEIEKKFIEELDAENRKKEIVSEIISALDIEKHDEETIATFEERLLKEIKAKEKNWIERF